MKKIELKIIGLSYSQAQAGSYVLILGDTKSNMKLPIIIKPADAQYIAMKLENMTTPRPLTQDIFKKITDNIDLDLQQVYITHVLEGIFYAKLVFSNSIVDFEIPCSVGDAISLSLSYECPIFCSADVIKTSGILIGDDGEISDEEYEENHKERDYSVTMSVENLEHMLQRALDNEEYEIASQLRDRISDLKKEEE